MHSLLTGVRVWNMRGDLLKGFELDECPGGPHETRERIRKWSLSTDPVHGSVMRSKVLIGADGVNSVVAKWMGLAPARYAGYMGIRGLAEYREGHLRIRLTQYLGIGTRIGVVPTSRTKFYWFIVYNKANPGGNDGSSQGLPRTTAGCVGPHSDGDAIQGTDHGSMESAGESITSGAELCNFGRGCVSSDDTEFRSGGCCAMEDSIALARTLGPVLVQGGNPNATVITEALEEYAAERNRRTLAVTVKSFILGYLMMIAFRPFVYFRDKLFDAQICITHYLSHPNDV
ncbi:hypothetical protein R1sor_015986 [Riccia sorocarpa]|uniref:FAD-binding domain-containing protein n=1 Tax=Riccia sorocarpa TaxID=122646 RepID=A0ABD3HGH3_9MARC